MEVTNQPAVVVPAVVAAAAVPETPVVVPAPAPAPTAVVPEVKVEAVAAPVNPATVQTGNPALDTAIGVMLNTVQATQADVDRLVNKALEHNAVDLIDAAFARERFGDKADAIVQLAQAAVTENIARSQRTIQEVHTLAGGAENWQQIVSVFNSNAADHIRAAAKAMLDSGQVQQGAKFIMEQVQNSGLLIQQGQQVGGGAVVPAANGALSATAFAAEMNALRKEAGNRSLESGPFAERYQQLVQRRTAGRQLNL